MAHPYRISQAAIDQRLAQQDEHYLQTFRTCRFTLFRIDVYQRQLTYLVANDSPTQAVFNYMTQILLSVLAVSALRLLTDRFGLSGFVNILLMSAFYLTVIYLEWRLLRRP